MSGFPRLGGLVPVALGVAAVLVACMPGRVEVGRDSTVDVFTAGEPGAAAAGASPAEANGGASGADGAQSGAEAARGPAAQGGAAGEGGTITGGSPSSGVGGSSGSAALLCPTPGTPDATLWPLDTFCRTFGCASSIEAAKVYLLSQYSDCSGLRAEVSDGCGRLLVSLSAGSSVGVYLFEGEPPALVGASIQRDVPFGPCNVDSYFGGVMPGACATATTCTFCGPEATCPP